MQVTNQVKNNLERFAKKPQKYFKYNNKEPVCPVTIIWLFNQIHNSQNPNGQHARNNNYFIKKMVKKLD